jgi:ABC-type tungstate transport system permease subunit/ABC-type tungstate transport system substrate-binding protein
VRRAAPCALLALALALPACGREAPREVVLATTTTTIDTGLMDALLPLFTRRSGIEVKVVAAGTGAVLEMAARGDADAILCHAPASEARYVASGDLVLGRPVMHNDFVLAGPPDDPAGIRAAGGLAAAARAIAARGPFVSRGDDSGTHKAELELWRGAGVDVRAVRGREETGAGMAATLHVADERGAYVLTDRGTYLAHRANLRLAILFEGDPALRNVYHAYLVNPARHAGGRAAAATALLDFLVSPEAQGAIAAFRRAELGEPLFLPDAVPAAAGDAPLVETEGVGAILARTIVVSGAATLLAMALGVPAGYALARGRFRGRALVLGAANAGMGLPPVLVGLGVWLVLSRSGPLGGLELVYTRRAMVIAQVLIAAPQVAAFTATSLEMLPAGLADLLAVLGASRLRRAWLLCREADLGLLAAIMAGFGAVVSEVGASMTVGGNLRGSTRVLTTAIVTETGRGDDARAIALGAVLLGLTFAVNVLLTAIQRRRRP